MMTRRTRIMLFLLIGLSSLFTFWSCSAKQQLKDFESDGCSLFPDKSPITDEDWCECCVEHDIAYWQGGEEEHRQTADNVFKQCIVDKTHNEPLAELMYNGVRLGGSPHFPTWYRWGYGWTDMRGYKTLTPAERKQAQENLEAYDAANKQRTCATNR